MWIPFLAGLSACLSALLYNEFIDNKLTNKDYIKIYLFSFLFSFIVVSGIITWFCKSILGWEFEGYVYDVFILFMTSVFYIYSLDMTMEVCENVHFNTEKPVVKDTFFTMTDPDKEGEGAGAGKGKEKEKDFIFVSTYEDFVQPAEVQGPSRIHEMDNRTKNLIKKINSSDEVYSSHKYKYKNIIEQYTVLGRSMPTDRAWTERLTTGKVMGLPGYENSVIGDPKLTDNDKKELINARRDFINQVHTLKQDNELMVGIWFHLMKSNPMDLENWVSSYKLTSREPHMAYAAAWMINQAVIFKYEEILSMHNHITGSYLARHTGLGDIVPNRGRSVLTNPKLMGTGFDKKNSLNPAEVWAFGQKRLEQLERAHNLLKENRDVSDM